MSIVGSVQDVLGGSQYDKAAEAIRAGTAQGQAALEPYAAMGERGREELDAFLSDPMGHEGFRSTFEHQTKLFRQRLLAKGKARTRLMGEGAAGIFAKVHGMITGQLAQPLQIARGASTAQAAGLMGAASQIMGVGAARGTLMNNLLTAGMGSAAMASVRQDQQGAYQAGYGAAYSGATNAFASIYGPAYYGST